MSDPRHILGFIDAGKDLRQRASGRAMGNRANIVVVEHHDWHLYY
jgi:hypothetical protein